MNANLPASWQRLCDADPAGGTIATATDFGAMGPTRAALIPVLEQNPRVRAGGDPQNASLGHTTGRLLMRLAELFRQPDRSRPVERALNRPVQAGRLDLTMATNSSVRIVRLRVAGVKHYASATKHTGRNSGIF
jgi:hypothetical protein